MSDLSDSIRTRYALLDVALQGAISDANRRGRDDVAVSLRKAQAHLTLAGLELNDARHRLRKYDDAK
ncbi:hypothetical protein [Bifidobacterium myosotis]|uniref:Uncharacterized protein n=1 Tax=Bifidobacterium myosotis TaxID=1630166 RepID=A0A5M9ZJZ0_9BIFI|nr:hypothetical protein [Bifidobacterium myosotis]KAA8827202.1 hypothetical protein EMO91_09115 [Bifidobacterium myosotis]